MQNFSHVVRCDAFMPQIRVVQALSATTKRSSPRYERRCNSGARKPARGAAAWPSSTLPVAMKRTTSSVWRRQTAASTMCASCQHHRFHADSAFGSCRQLLSFMPSIAPVHAEHRTRHADRRIRHTVSPTRHADEGRHPRLSCLHRGKSWMPTFVGTTGVAQSVVRAGLRRHDESGAVCRGRRPLSARRAWRRLSWMPVVAGMTSVA